MDSAFHHFNGDYEYLSKYQLGNKGSRLNTLSNFMCELPAYDRKRILRRAQLTESHFLSSQENVGINLMAGVSQSLCRVSGNESYLSEMGLKNALLFMKNPANHDLKKEKSISDFYLKFVEDYTPVVESNRNYRVLSASQEKIVLETTAKEEAGDFLKSHPDKIKVFSDAIGGFFKGISVHFNGRTSMVNRLLSGKPGSDSILFEVVFN